MKENVLQLQVESALLQDDLTQDYGIEVLDSNGVITRCCPKLLFHSLG